MPMEGTGGVRTPPLLKSIDFLIKISVVVLLLKSKDEYVFRNIHVKYKEFQRKERIIDESQL